MLSTAYFSPNRAPWETFAGYPRTFISLGGAEVFVEEVHELAEKLARNGVDVMVDVQVRVTRESSGLVLILSLFLSLQPDAVHDFLAFPGVFPSERAREGVRKAIVGWVGSLPDM